MGDVSLVAVAGCRQLGDEFLVAVAYMRDNRGEPGYGWALEVQVFRLFTLRSARSVRRASVR